MKNLFLGLLALIVLAGDVALAQTGQPQVLRPPGGLALDTGTKTAAAVSGAVTLNKLAGVITSEALTTAAGAVYTLTITDSRIAAADQVFVEVGNGTNTTVGPSKAGVNVSAGSAVINIRNTHASAALNGTLVVSFIVLKN